MKMKPIITFDEASRQWLDRQLKKPEAPTPPPRWRIAVMAVMVFLASFTFASATLSFVLSLKPASQPCAGNVEIAKDQERIK